MRSGRLRPSAAAMRVRSVLTIGPPRPFKLAQNCLLLCCFHGMGVRLSNVRNPFCRRHPTSDPVGSPHGTGSTRTASTVNDHLRTGWQLPNHLDELVELLQRRRMEIPNLDCVTSPARLADLGGVVLWFLLTLVKKAYQDRESVSAQLRKLRFGRVVSPEENGLIDPPRSHVATFLVRSLPIRFVAKVPRGGLGDLKAGR